MLALEGEGDFRSFGFESGFFLCARRGFCFGRLQGWKCSGDGQGLAYGVDDGVRAHLFGCDFCFVKRGLVWLCVDALFRLGLHGRSPFCRGEDAPSHWGVQVNSRS